MPPALYVPDGDRLVPSPLTAGPWAPDAQHGGPVAGLLTRTIERAPAPGPMELLRVTVELLRPVPLRPLEARAEVLRPGRNVQLVEAFLLHDGVEVARARGLRLRVAEIDVPAPPDPPPPPLPPDSARIGGEAARTAFLGAVDLRFVSGSWYEEGPAVVWGRLDAPLVAGEETSATAQAAAIADFGNGISRVIPFETHRFINPDLTVALARPPRGDWIGLDVVSRLSPGGFGQAEGQLFDAGGPVGRSIQTLLVDRTR